ncbi:Glycoside hydrolase superfamily,Glycosyl hydrolase, family 13, catalytic domain [Cinara cedri]|uniref:alpha-glucosidase n=1 Tax=Cinara cedri TaxID=506608 RepID=A0A5E4MMN9_9HEMI|nr:Glycoside hydrolase superfamily,Glycosyl hydrolase, family 13, catalytic domain [Cinara cedri]
MDMQTFHLYWLITLAYASVNITGNVYFPTRKFDSEWWSNTIIYQAYPRSFKDSNRDGVGDLKGIIQKLDHFVDLGIETIWVGPIFKSPMIDMGYDVENFTLIDPLFGTMDDFDELVSEMDKRSKFDRFESSAWTWNEERKQFYFHQFNPQQPDFNVRNPQVHLEFFNIMGFWLDRGVSGFRFDAVGYLYENNSFTDEPIIPGKEGSSYNDLNHIYTKNQPEVIDTLIQWRKYAEDFRKKNNKKNSVLIATESYTSINTLMQYYGNITNPGAQIPFNFQLLGMDRNNLLEQTEQGIKKWIENIPENMVPNWVIENHDLFRMSFYYGAEFIQLFTVLKLALPGVDVTYYGSEIGMDNTYMRPDQIKDIYSLKLYKSFGIAGLTRDVSRSPMQWDDSINAGFTDAKLPWLPVNPNYYHLNVEAQKKIPTSHYNVYKKMSQLRKTDTLKYGDLQTYNISKSIYIIKR